MQTLHFRPKNLVKRIIYCNFVHYKWGFLATKALVTLKYKEIGKISKDLCFISTPCSKMRVTIIIARI